MTASPGPSATRRGFKLKFTHAAAGAILPPMNPIGLENTAIGQPSADGVI